MRLRAVAMIVVCTAANFGNWVFRPSYSVAALWSGGRNRLWRACFGFTGLVMMASAALGAPGQTNAAVPVDIEIVRAQGFLIFGAFGNPGTACTNANSIWVALSHPEYQYLLSVSLTALATGMKLDAYVDACTSIGWHGGTFNELTSNGAMFIKR